MSTKTHNTLVCASDFFPVNEQEISILKQRAEHISKIGNVVKEAIKSIVYIHFLLNNEHYGISYEHASEVMQNIPITIVPHTPVFVAGVINIRGLLLNVIDMKKYFHFKQSSQLENHTIIVVKNKKVEIAMLVDKIIDIRSCNAEELTPPIQTSNAIKSDYIVGIDQENIAIININTTLSDIELQLAR